MICGMLRDVGQTLQFQETTWTDSLFVKKDQNRNSFYSMYSSSLSKSGAYITHSATRPQTVLSEI